MQLKMVNSSQWTENYISIFPKLSWSKDELWSLQEGQVIEGVCEQDALYLGNTAETLLPCIDSESLFIQEIGLKCMLVIHTAHINALQFKMTNYCVKILLCI